MEDKILKNILDDLSIGKSAALVTLTDNKGSVPGKDGSIMGVFENKVLGTIGGGKVEAKVIEEARNCIINGNNLDFSWDMGEKNGLACGGQTKGYIKVFKPNKKLIIFGSGHIGRKISLLAKELEFDIYVVDDRKEYKDLPEFKHVKSYLTYPNKDITKYLDFDENTFVVLATRSHQLDQEALKEIINLNVAYLGMVGSRHKVVKVYNNLISEGTKESLFEKVFAPIGLSIDNGTPEEIAFSILSQILMIKNKKDGKSLSEK